MSCGVSTNLGIVYTMFALSLIRIINDKIFFLVSKFSFKKYCLGEKNKNSAEIGRFLRLLLEMLNQENVKYLGIPPLINSEKIS